MRDALDTLREALRTKTNVELREEDVAIGNKRIPRKTPTSFQASGSDQRYSLDAVYFQYTHPKQGYRDYVAACEKAGVDFIKLRDKRKLLDYLDGKIETCSNIKRDTSEQPDTAFEKTKRETSKDHEQEKDRAIAQQKEDKSSVSGDAGTGKPSRSYIKGSLYERVLAIERHQRTRESVMAVAGRDFSWLRTKMDEHIRNKKTQMRRGGSRGSSHPAESRVPTFDPRGDRYRVKHDRVWRETMGEDFGEINIDPSGSFIKPQPASAPKPAAESRRVEPYSSATRKRPAPAGHSAQPHSQARRLSPRDRVPIIIAPAPSRGIIVNAANLPRLIESSEFYSTEAMKAAGMRTIVKPIVACKRDPGGNMRGIPAQYEVVSNVSRMDDPAWGRVVAVVCSGQEWQFKNWPFTGSLPEIFRKIQGFYFYYEDEPMHPKVKDWAVRKLGVSRNRRHMDSRVMTEFWSAVDKHISTNKPFLHF